MLAVILMVAAGSTVAAKQAKPAKPTPTPTPSKAALSFTPAAHDFGRVAEGVAVTRTSGSPTPGAPPPAGSRLG